MQRRALQDISTSPFMFRAGYSESNMPTADHDITSPEERVIQQRTRLLTSRSLSFDIFLRNETFGETPKKDGPLLHMKRKRLQLSPASATKKPKRAKLTRCEVCPLKTTLSAYSTRELVGVLDSLIADHPELEEKVRHVLPQPDILPLEEKLVHLRHNVYRALPSNRLETSRDAYAFKRVKLHIEAFKKVCVEQGRLLVLAGCWDAVIKYVLVACSCVHQLPDWDNPSHNILKQSCYRALATQCMVAVRQGCFSHEALLDLRSRFQAALRFSNELQPCMNQVERLLQ